MQYFRLTSRIAGIGLGLGSCWILLAGSLFAAEPQAETDLTVVASTALELQVTLAELWTVPFLAGDGALVQDNNISFKLGAVLTPVTANAIAEVTWTPIAFLQVVAGAQLGSGWDIGFAHGLSLNLRSGLHDNRLTADAFSAALWKVKAGAAFQFDVAALAPGDWNHLVFRSYHEIFYRGLTGVADDVAWMFENDPGENHNGWNYYGNYFLGYKMPILLDMVGVLLEHDLFLYTTPGRSLWGDDLLRWNFGPVLDFRFSDSVSLAVLAQFWSQRNFSAGTAAYGFYQDRVLDTANPLSIVFHRAAVVLAVKL